MLKLYHTPISFNSRRVWVTLLEKGLDFELISVDLSGDQFRREFLQLNPFHHIPVLVDDEVTVIESLAILDYIEAKYPNPSLLPSDPQTLATVRMVEMVTVNELLAATTPLFRQTMGFAEVETQILKKSEKKIQTVLEFFAKLLAEKTYFGGEQLTLADIVAGTAIPLLPMLGVSLTNYSQLSAWLKRLMQRDSWQQTKATQEQIDQFKATMQKMMAQRGN